MSDNRLPTLTVTLFLLTGCLGAEEAQQPRPEKQAFQDAGNWPQTEPGSVSLKNFRPFRAVYQRAYSNRQGQPRTDRVIISAEKVGWDGHAAILVSLIDSGDPQWEDTAARNLFMIADGEDLQLYFESGPIPGKAKDYYFIRPDEGMGTMVDTAAGSVQNREMPAGAKGWGPPAWALASMELTDGMKVRLGPMISPASHVLGVTQGIAKGRREFTDLSGKTHSAWLIETAGNPTSSRMGQVLLIPEPPYFLARFSRDLDSGEESKGTRLLSFEYLN